MTLLLTAKLDLCSDFVQITLNLLIITIQLNRLLRLSRMVLFSIFAF